MACAAGGVAVIAALCIAAIVALAALGLQPGAAGRPAELAGRTCALICEAATDPPPDGMPFSHSEQVAALISAGCCAGTASPMLYAVPNGRRLLSADGAAGEQQLFESPLAALDGAVSQGWVKDERVSDAPGALLQHAAPFLEPTGEEEQARLPGVHIGGEAAEEVTRPGTVQACCAAHARAPQQQLAWTMSFMHHEHSPFAVAGTYDPYSGRGAVPDASDAAAHATGRRGTPSAAALLHHTDHFAAGGEEADAGSDDQLWSGFLGAGRALRGARGRVASFLSSFVKSGEDRTPTILLGYTPRDARGPFTSPAAAAQLPGMADAWPQRAQSVWVNAGMANAPGTTIPEQVVGLAEVQRHAESEMRQLRDRFRQAERDPDSDLGHGPGASPERLPAKYVLQPERAIAQHTWDRAHPHAADERARRAAGPGGYPPAAATPQREPVRAAEQAAPSVGQEEPAEEQESWTDRPAPAWAQQQPPEADAPAEERAAPQSLAAAPSAPRGAPSAAAVRRVLSRFRPVKVEGRQYVPVFVPSGGAPGPAAGMRRAGALAQETRGVVGERAKLEALGRKMDRVEAQMGAVVAAVRADGAGARGRGGARGGAAPAPPTAPLLARLSKIVDSLAAMHRGRLRAPATALAAHSLTRTYPRVHGGPAGGCAAMCAAARSARYGGGVDPARLGCDCPAAPPAASSAPARTTAAARPAPQVPAQPARPVARPAAAPPPADPRLVPVASDTGAAQGLTAAHGPASARAWRPQGIRNGVPLGVTAGDGAPPAPRAAAAGAAAGAAAPGAAGSAASARGAWSRAMRAVAVAAEDLSEALQRSGDVAAGAMGTRGLSDPGLLGMLRHAMLVGNETDGAEWVNGTDAGAANATAEAEGEEADAGAGAAGAEELRMYPAGVHLGSKFQWEGQDGREFRVTQAALRFCHGQFVSEAEVRYCFRRLLLPADAARRAEELARQRSLLLGEEAPAANATAVGNGTAPQAGAVDADVTVDA